MAGFKSKNIEWDNVAGDQDINGFLNAVHDNYLKQGIRKHTKEKTYYKVITQSTIYARADGQLDSRAHYKISV